MQTARRPYGASRHRRDCEDGIFDAQRSSPAHPAVACGDFRKYFRNGYLYRNDAPARALAQPSITLRAPLPECRVRGDLSTPKSYPRV